MKKENLKEIKELLLVVDMVNGFVREGAMKSQNIEHIIPEIENTVKNFTYGVDKLVSFIKDCHVKNSREFERFPKHCLEGTNESELVDELKKYENMALVFNKNSTSAVFAPEFLNTIDEMKSLKDIYIVGCCTDICVINLAIPLQNYFDENNRDVSISVLKDQVETYDSSNHKAKEWNKMSFKFMEASGIKILKKYRE